MKDCPENELLQVVTVGVGSDVIDYYRQEKVGINEDTTVFYVFHKKGSVPKELLN